MESISALISTVVKVLFGYDFFEKPGQDKRTLEQKSRDLKNKIDFWKVRAHKRYRYPYPDKLLSTFEQARELLSYKKKTFNEIRNLRITLFVLGVATILGVLLSKRILTYLAATASIVNLIGMFTRYGFNYLQEDKLAGELKSSTLILEMIAAEHRLP